MGRGQRAERCVSQVLTSDAALAGRPAASSLEPPAPPSQSRPAAVHFVCQAPYRPGPPAARAKLLSPAGCSSGTWEA